MLTRFLMRMGLLALVAAMIPVSVELFDQLTCRPATASIERLRRDRVVLKFEAAGGQTVTAEASMAKAGLHFDYRNSELYAGTTRLRAGDPVQILYRGVGRAEGPYISHPFALSEHRLEGLVGLAGLAMLSLGGLGLAVTGRLARNA